METNVISKIKDFIITKLSIEEQFALENLNPVAAPAVMPTDEKKPSTDQTPEIKMKETKTKDGLVFAHDGELIIGTPIMDVTSGTPTPIVDGVYEMEDGNVITVASGLVTEIESKEVEAIEPAAPVEMQMSAMKVSLDSQIANLSKQVILLHKVINEILNTPIQTETKTSKNWEELSSLEKFRLTK